MFTATCPVSGVHSRSKMSDVDDMIGYYDKTYCSVGQWFLEPAKTIVLGQTTDQACRFCGKRAPGVTFDLVAHAIPESLGNKNLLSAYECDSCNRLFGSSIENDFGNWSKPMRTFARIRGKNGVPTLKKDSRGGWRIEYGLTGFKIEQYEADPISEINEKERQITFQLRRDPFTPVAVLKAFVKMGLSVMPDAEMRSFSHALRWIRNTDHRVGLVSEFPILYSFIPGPMANDKIVLLLFRRRDGIEDVPYAFFILSYGNEVFQVYLPSPKRDHTIHGKQLQLMPFPHPNDISPSGYGSVQRRVLNLTGLDVVKGEIVTLTMGFERAETDLAASDEAAGSS